MHHDVLGELIPEGDSEDHTATIPYGSRRIKIGIFPDDQPLEAVLQFAAAIVAHLPDLDTAAKRIAIRDLREIYNSGWNESDETQPDGSPHSVSNPTLSDAEFEEKLSLTGINVTGVEAIDFFYNNQNLFHGHAVLVTSLRGLDLTDARAELFG